MELNCYRPTSSGSQPICTSIAYNSASVFGVLQFPVTMRTSPDIDQSSVANQFTVTGNNSSVNFTTFGFNERNANAITLYNIESVAVTTGYGYWFRNNASGTGQKLAFTAEL
jgi:hypothetical protein